MRAREIAISLQTQNSNNNYSTDDSLNISSSALSSHASTIDHATDMHPPSGSHGLSGRGILHKQHSGGDAESLKGRKRFSKRQSKSGLTAVFWFVWVSIALRSIMGEEIALAFARREERAWEHDESSALQETVGVFIVCKFVLLCCVYCAFVQVVGSASGWLLRHFALVDRILIFAFIPLWLRA